MIPLVIGRTAFKEAVRDRVLNVAAVFAVLMIGAILLLGNLTLGQEWPIIQDFGLSTIHLITVVLAVFMGSRLIARDLETRTLYVILSKPVSRAQFLAGKFLGGAAALWVLLGLLSTLYLALVTVTTHQLPVLHLGALGLFGLEAMVLLGLTMLFSSMTSPMLSILYTLGLYAIGHNTELIRSFAEKESPFEAAFAKLLYYALPNLQAFDLKNQVVYGNSLRLGDWAWSLSYGLTMVVAILTLSTLAFNQRELP